MKYPEALGACRKILPALLVCLPAAVHAGDPVDEWVRNCNQSQGLAYCQEKAKRLGDNNNSNATTVKLFNNYGAAVQNSLDAFDGKGAAASAPGVSLQKMIEQERAADAQAARAAYRKQLDEGYAAGKRAYVMRPVIWSYLQEGGALDEKFASADILEVLNDRSRSLFHRESRIASLRLTELAGGLTSYPLTADALSEFRRYAVGAGELAARISKQEQGLKNDVLYDAEAQFLRGIASELGGGDAGKPEAVKAYEAAVAYMRLPGLTDARGNRVSPTTYRSIVYAAARLSTLYREGVGGAPADPAKADALVADAGRIMEPLLKGKTAADTPEGGALVKTIVGEPRLLALFSGSTH